MDTHRPPLVLVIVNMHAPHVYQRETPQCTLLLSPLRLRNGLVAVVLKVKRSIAIIQDQWPTHSQRKCNLISNHRTSPPLLQLLQDHFPFPTIPPPTYPPTWRRQPGT